MGLLVLGTPLDWPESKKYCDYVRENGIMVRVISNEQLVGI